MSALQNNFWKIIFLLIVGGVAFLGYSKRHVPVVTATVEQSPPSSEVASKDEIEVVVKDFILNNPEVIIKSLELMQQRKVKEMEDEVQKVLNDKKSEIEDIESSPYAGNKTGDITIVTFIDPNCNYCKKSNEALNQLLSSDAGVKVIYKTFPILGEASEYSSKLLLATYKTTPAKFKPVLDDIMELKSVTKEELVAIVQKNGLDMSNLEIEMDKPEIKEMQVSTMALARDLRIQGAPASIINGTLYPGLLDINKLKEIAKEERAGEKK
jgi:protein-disulfide isomerase